MPQPSTPGSVLRLVAGLAIALLCAPPQLRAQTLPATTPPASPNASAGAVTVLATNGIVEVLRAGAQTWDFASTQPEKNILHPGDQLRTRRHSQATVRLADRTIARIAADGHLRVLRPLPSEVNLEVLRGRFFFLHRDEPGRVRIRTATVTAGIEGTEFSLEVADADGATQVYLFDGRVSMTNDSGHLTLANQQAAVVQPGQPPAPLPMLPAVHVIQWNLYYPAVLDPDELDLPAPAQEALQPSIAAYRRGDLRQALLHYPANTPPASVAEALYRAALLLAVGDTEQAQALLTTQETATPMTPRAQELAGALRLLIAAVKAQPPPPAHDPSPVTATAWLAQSYYRQSHSDLEGARSAARQAVTRAPHFAFALARLAELEFSFGQIGPAQQALDQSLALAPDNAAARSLEGFLLAARNRIPGAIAAFDLALSRDSSLANAWLGRGLCQIRRGHSQAGRDDLLVAAATEPQRAVLRSYLGKAFTDARHISLAKHELHLASQLDPLDPTAWLYAALLNHRDNRNNRAIHDLEHSQALNQNRQVYRSRQLLDQDRAVRGVNLANIYRDTGMNDVAFREAARAVHDDYANFSTHLFLANSFDAQRDPRQVNLRYETPWLTEYLLANLLAPVGAGTLSQLVSQQEYSRLFQRDRFGLASQTEYLSNGDWTQAASHHGQLDGWSYALEEFYRTQNGFRPNGDLEQLTLSAQAKIQLGPQDDVYLQAVYYEADGGDLAQHYATSEIHRAFSFVEHQEPLLLGGYHHAWNPGSHTLFLAARLDDRFSASDTNHPVVAFGVDPSGQVTDAGRFSNRLRYQSELEIYSTELQQLWESGDHRLIAGARYQRGEFDTQNVMPSYLFIPATTRQFETDFDRLALYAYHHWQILDSLRLIAGVTYDRLTYPENFRSPPIAPGRDDEDQWSPKAGAIWSPRAGTTFRAAYTRSLGGVSIDQSLQLEPSQVAGFVQSFRSLIPESVTGPAAAASYETYGVAWDQRFPTRTYLGVSAEWLRSEATRQEGVFLVPFPPAPVASTTPEDLDFDEQTLRVTLHQLVDEDWSFGATYRLSYADLEDTWPGVRPGIPTVGGFVRRQHLEALLHQVVLSAGWTAANGLFAQADSILISQDNDGYVQEVRDEEFWHFNVMAGYRFAQRRAEVAAGLLNLTDEDYRLNPLNLMPELPRERTVALRFRWAF